MAMLKTSSGNVLHLGKRLARGAQGEIFELVGQPDVVFKQYFRGELAKDSSLEDRLIHMAGHRPKGWKEQGSNHVVLTWPSEVVYDGQDFVGYVMPRINPSESAVLNQVSDPTDRNEPRSRLPWLSGFNWNYLVAVAVNLASAVKILHEPNTNINVVIGDFNDLNVLVTHQARVTLVDCDSMQINDTGAAKTFLCRGIMQDFLAPELSGCNLKITARQPPSDLFALAVHLHKLLLQGEYPFRGLWSGAGDAPEEIELAKRGRWIYAKSHVLSPRPGAVDIDLLPPNIIDLFHRAFVEGSSDPQARPTAAEWRTQLQQLHHGLRQCSKDQAHWYPAHHNSCPWCSSQAQASVNGQVVLPSASPAQTQGPRSNQLLSHSGKPILAKPLPQGVINISSGHATSKVLPPIQARIWTRVTRPGLVRRKVTSLLAIGLAYLFMFLTGLANGSNWGGVWGDLLALCAAFTIVLAIAELILDWS